MRPLKSYQFNEMLQRLAMLSECETLTGAFDIEYAALLDAIRQDVSDRKHKWLERLAALKARQLAFKMELQSTKRKSSNSGDSQGLVIE